MSADDDLLRLLDKLKAPGAMFLTAQALSEVYAAAYAKAEAAGYGRRDGEEAVASFVRAARVAWGLVE